MARALDQFFEIHIAVAKSGFRFASCGGEQGRHLFDVFNFAHSFAAAARRRFNQQRKTNRRREAQQIFVGPIAHVFGAGHNRHARFDDRRARLAFIAHRRNGRRIRTDKLNAALAALFRKIFALGEKAITGMNRVRARFFRRLKNFIRAQIGFARRRGTDEIRFIRIAHMQRVAIRFRKNSDGFQPKFAASANHADGNFAAIGDQNLIEHRRFF